MSGENPAQGYLAELTVDIGARGIAAVQRKLRPSPLELVFDRAISGCVHTGPVYIAGTNVPVLAEWLRVGVTSLEAVDGVRVQAFRSTSSTSFRTFTERRSSNSCTSCRGWCPGSRPASMS